MNARIFATGLLSLCASASFALENGLARTPPMGWNSWNTFAGNIDETKIKGVIDVMVANGMKDLGYIYVNLDDNWMANPARDASGKLQADAKRFPNGIKALSDYAHAKGMKLGIYSDRGSMTCMNVPQSGGYGHEADDAKTYASWGIDYLKYDNCNTVGQMQSDYTTMSKALLASGRPIVFSICAWQTQSWMPDQGNLWRSTTDIADAWGPTGWSVLGNWDGQVGNYIYTRPGAWSDPDMLEVGHGKLTEDESRSHMGLWALAAAPLIAGNDVRSMSSTIKAILTNPDVIAVDQDSAGIQCRKISDNGDLEVYVKPLGKDFSTFAVGFLNRSSSTQSLSINWSSLRLDPSSVTVRDLWNRTDLGIKKDGYTVSVPSHGLALIKAKGTPDASATWWASDLPFTLLSNGYGTFKQDKSIDGKDLKLGTKTYAKGFGTNAASKIVLPIYGKFDRFQADVGIDGEVNSGGSVAFQVLGDGKSLFQSNVLKSGGAPVAVDISVAGVDSLVLVATDGGDGISYDHADWAGARFTFSQTPTGILAARGAVHDWQAQVRGDLLSIRRTDAEPTILAVRDLSGRLALKRSVAGTNAEIDLTGLPHGTYIAQLLSSPSQRIFVRN